MKVTAVSVIGDVADAREGVVFSSRTKRVSVTTTQLKPLQDRWLFLSDY
jgi:hypothetical protein